MSNKTPKTSRVATDMTSVRNIVAITITLCLASAAAAVDGVVQINQVRALAGGVSDGDRPGFPVNISEPGSYRLTGDLAVADPSVSAILISAAAVTIDLNGFTIHGPSKCAAFGCDVDGWGKGISKQAGTDPVAIIVRNGTVRGMPLGGVFLGPYAVVEGVKAIGNGGQGVSVGKGSIVTNVMVSGNSMQGLFTHDGCNVSSVAADENGDVGIQVGAGCAVRQVTSARNADTGFVATGDGNSLIGGTFRNNAQAGVRFVGPSSFSNGYANNVISGSPLLTVAGPGMEANLCGDDAC